eukprot:2531520-Pyramimonas_sp.AAC.1
MSALLDAVDTELAERPPDYPDIPYIVAKDALRGRHTVGLSGPGLAATPFPHDRGFWETIWFRPERREKTILLRVRSEDTAVGPNGEAITCEDHA